MIKCIVLAVVMAGLLSACTVAGVPGAFSIDAARAVVKQYNDKMMSELLPVMCGNTRRAEDKFIKDNSLDRKAFNKLCKR